MPNAVIAGYARSPFHLASKGDLARVRADDLAAVLRPRLSGRSSYLEMERTIERVRSCGALKQARSAEVSRGAGARRAPGGAARDDRDVEGLETRRRKCGCADK